MYTLHKDYVSHLSGADELRCKDQKSVNEYVGTIYNSGYKHNPDLFSVFLLEKLVIVEEEKRASAVIFQAWDRIMKFTPQSQGQTGKV